MNSLKYPQPEYQADRESQLARAWEVRNKRTGEWAQSWGGSRPSAASNISKPQEDSSYGGWDGEGQPQVIMRLARRTRKTRGVGLGNRMVVMKFQCQPHRESNGKASKVLARIYQIKFSFKMHHSMSHEKQGYRSGMKQKTYLKASHSYPQETRVFMYSKSLLMGWGKYSTQ